MRGGYVAVDYIVQEIEFGELVWSKGNIHKVVKAKLIWTVGSRRKHDKYLCVLAKHTSKEDEGGGYNTVEAQSCKED
jgi:hypothetical protein